MTDTVLVLGGYGNFGQRICAALVADGDKDVVIAGRRLDQAQALAHRLGGRARALALDHEAPAFGAHLRELRPAVLIHTSGPFQGQDYHIARACIDAGCHYIDLADGRAYVAGIAALDAAARAAGVLAVSGASSLPALSSAVVDEHLVHFARLDSIEHGISAGAKPPGLATMAGVMSYVGKPFRRWQDGAWRTVHGWQDLTGHRYSPPVGRRYIASCDVPDLDLFPLRYPSVASVVFRAGVGFGSTSVATWILSWLVRAGLIASLSAWARPLHRVATRIEPLGSVWSAMHVTLSGLGHDGQPRRLTWELLAGDNDGPNIPCFPALALTRKLLAGRVADRGARPCLGLLTVDEILTAIPGLNLRWRTA